MAEMPPMSLEAEAALEMASAPIWLSIIKSLKVEEVSGDFFSEDLSSGNSDASLVFATIKSSESLSNSFSIFSLISCPSILLMGSVVVSFNGASE